MFKPLVYIVEPDQLVNKILTDKLRDSYFNVESWHEGFSAWRKAKIVLPQLLITENYLPDISSFDLVRLFRSTPKTANIGIIVHASDISRFEIEEFMSLGANGIIFKKENSLERFPHFIRAYVS